MAENITIHRPLKYSTVVSIYITDICGAVEKFTPRVIAKKWGFVGEFSVPAMNCIPHECRYFSDGLYTFNTESVLTQEEFDELVTELHLELHEDSGIIGSIGTPAFGSEGVPVMVLHPNQTVERYSRYRCYHQTNILVTPFYADKEGGKFPKNDWEEVKAIAKAILSGEKPDNNDFAAEF